MRSAKATKLFRALEDFKGIDEERAALAVSAYVTRKVVLFAIIEAIAVYGFVLAFLGRFVADQYRLSALTWFLAIEFPSEKSLAVILQALSKTQRKAVEQSRLEPSFTRRSAICRVWSESAGPSQVASEKIRRGISLAPRLGHMVRGHLRIDEVKIPALQFLHQRRQRHL